MAEKQVGIALAKQTSDSVMAKIKQFEERGELSFPMNYSPENAMKSAWLKLQTVKDRNDKPALEVCSMDSLANALLSMVVQGLNPDKAQCYFIVYGNQLALQRSYFGSQAVAKRVDETISDIYADVIYDGDVFKTCKKQGRTIVLEHTQDFANVKKERITGAYCTVLYESGLEESTVMTMEEIKQAWRMSKTAPLNDDGSIKPGSTHGKFTGEMCKKTVINRACKKIFNTSDDHNLVASVARETDVAAAEAEAAESIRVNANTGELIDVDYIDAEGDPMPEAPANPA